MCQKCQIQTDENGAFSPGKGDAQAACCLLLGLWGLNESEEGKKQKERETEGGEESENEWTLQSDLKFIFNQASRSQTTVLLGAKKYNFTQTNLKNGAGGRKATLYKQINKQVSQP